MQTPWQFTTWLELLDHWQTGLAGLIALFAAIAARMVESLSRMPAPIIYSANAGKIGLLEGDAMNVVIVYTLLESARDAATRLATTYRPPDNIDRAVVMKTAEPRRVGGGAGGP